MIRSLRSAREFQELRSTGRRVTHGPLTMIVSAPDGAGGSQVAFAIGRRVGTAVTRNRLRRRLRAVLSDIDRHGDLASARYLMIPDPRLVDLSHSELVSCVSGALGRVSSAA